MDQTLIYRIQIPMKTKSFPKVNGDSIHHQHSICSTGLEYSRSGSETISHPAIHQSIQSFTQEVKSNNPTAISSSSTSIIQVVQAFKQIIELFENEL